MILDTCALLWLASGDDHLSPPVRERIDNAPVVHVSAISGFEIGLKWLQKKLTLPVPPAEWFEAIIEHHRLDLVPLDLESCLGAVMLPPIHRDPCDRFIIATARARGWPVVTADPVFEQYGVEVILCEG